MLKRDGVEINAVLDLDIDDHLLIHRVLGRLIHPPSGRTYHEEFCPPKVPMTDDVHPKFYVITLLLPYLDNRRAINQEIR